MAPPLFTKRLVDSTAEEGSSYQLEATVEGHPLPVVSWSKDGKCVDESPDYVITFNNGECVLRFEEVFMEDQAEYSCKATNDLGEDITKARMSVAGILFWFFLFTVQFRQHDTFSITIRGIIG